MGGVVEVVEGVVWSEWLRGWCCVVGVVEGVVWLSG